MSNTLSAHDALSRKNTNIMAVIHQQLKTIFLEDSYVIENPFLPPKQGDLIVLGSHCVICKNSICKDTSCSIYYGGTYCIECAKSRTTMFPKTVQDKLNKIIKDYLGPLLLLVSFCYVRYIDYCY